MLFGKIGGIYKWTTVAETVSGFNTTTTYNTTRETNTTFSTSRLTSRLTSTTFNTTTTFNTSVNTSTDQGNIFTILVNTIVGSIDEPSYAWASQPNGALVWWNETFGNGSTIALTQSNNSALFIDGTFYRYIKGSYMYTDDFVLTNGPRDYYKVNREFLTSFTRSTNRTTATTVLNAKSTSYSTVFNTSVTTTTTFSTSRTTTTGLIKNTDRITDYYQ